MMNSKIILTAITIFSVLGVIAQDDVLFLNSFDSFSVRAEKSANPECLRWANPSLELRAFPGVRGKGNAVALADHEYLLYRGEKNLNPTEGTVSFWFSPQQDLASDTLHVYCSISFGNGTLTLHQSPVYRGKMILSLFIPPQNGKPARSQQATWELPPGFLQKGVWHKADIVWNTEYFSLYLDGALQKIKPSEHWLKVSRSKSPIPAGFRFTVDSKSRLSFNWQITGKKPSIGFLMAYDEISVSNRALNNEEIQKGYNKYFSSRFALSAIPHFFELPYSQKPVVIDGKIDDTEWSDSARIPVDRSAKPLEIHNPVCATAAVKYDKEFLYAAFRVPVLPEKRKAVKHDDNVYADDCFELHYFDTVHKRQYQFVINANGALYDARITDRNPIMWNSSAKGAAFMGKDFWSAELSIPLQDIGGGATGTEGKINLCSVSYRNGKPFYNMFASSEQGFLHEGSMAKFRFGDKSGGFILPCSSVTAGGEFSTFFCTKQSVKVSARVESETESTATCPFELNGKKWTITKGPGNHIFHLSVMSPDGKKSMLEYRYLYGV